LTKEGLRPDLRFFPGVFVVLLLKTDGGATWSEANEGITTRQVWFMAATDYYLFAASPVAGVFRSTNSGASWTPIDNGLKDPTVTCLALKGLNLHAAGGGLLYRS
jgi:hypothetical protein